MSEWLSLGALRGSFLCPRKRRVKGLDLKSWNFPVFYVSWWDLKILRYAVSRVREQVHEDRKTESETVNQRAEEQKRKKRYERRKQLRLAAKAKAKQEKSGETRNL